MRVFQTPIERGRDSQASFTEKQIAEERLKELQSITAPFVLRRTSDIMRSVLPTKHEITVFCALKPDQRDKYVSFCNSQKIRSYLTSMSSSSAASKGTVWALRLITQLKQLCTHESLVKGDDGDGDNGDDDGEEEGIKTLSRTTDDIAAAACAESGKLAVLQDLLASVKGRRERIVLVSSYTTTLSLLQLLCEKSWGYSFVRLDGSVKASDRTSIVRRFTDPQSDTFIFLLSAKAGGCGLNLIGANRLVLLDPDWNPAVDAQAMARVWRDGQRKSQVYIYRFLSTGTIEERIFQRQLMKHKVADGLLVDSSKAV